MASRTFELIMLNKSLANRSGTLFPQVRERLELVSVLWQRRNTMIGATPIFLASTLVRYDLLVGHYTVNKAASYPRAEIQKSEPSLHK